MDDRAQRTAHRIQGRSAAPGIALGPLVLLSPVKHQARQDRSNREEHQALVDALAHHVPRSTSVTRATRRKPAALRVLGS